MAVTYETAGASAWVRLNRPQALNALDRDTLAQLGQCMRRAEADDAVRVVVLTGAGRAFCAGGDIHALAADVGPDGQATAGTPDYIDGVVEAFAAVRALTKPLVACVNGVAVGGGLELILCADLVVASAEARIGDGHIRYGIFPGGGSAAVLPRRVPLNVARHILMTGELLPAQAWARLGIVNVVVPPAELVAATQALADSLAEKSPLLLAALKRVSAATQDQPLADALALELRELRAHMRTQDMREGTRAFVEKRTPHFTGN